MKFQQPQRDKPFFATETRGGWDSWSEQRTVVTGIVLPDGTELSINDELLVDAEAADIDVEPDEFTVQIEFGGWIEFQEVEFDSWQPAFDTRLSESEFQNAWDDWLRYVRVPQRGPDPDETARCNSGAGPRRAQTRHQNR